VKETTFGVFTFFLLVSSRYLLIRLVSPANKPSSFPKLFVEQDALMSPNPRGKLEDLAAGCVCVV